MKPDILLPTALFDVLRDWMWNQRVTGIHDDEKKEDAHTLHFEGQSFYKDARRMPIRFQQSHWNFTIAYVDGKAMAVKSRDGEVYTSIDWTSVKPTWVKRDIS